MKNANSIHPSCDSLVLVMWPTFEWDMLHKVGLLIEDVSVKLFYAPFNSWAQLVKLSSLCYHIFDIVWAWSLLKKNIEERNEIEEIWLWKREIQVIDSIVEFDIWGLSINELMDNLIQQVPGYIDQKKPMRYIVLAKLSSRDTTFCQKMYLVRVKW